MMESIQSLSTIDRQLLTDECITPNNITEFQPHLAHSYKSSSQSPFQQQQQQQAKASTVLLLHPHYGNYRLILKDANIAFDRKAMSLLIRDIPSRAFCYDDIAVIDIYDANTITEITDLPVKLRSLLIHGCKTLAYMSIPFRNASTLETILIDNSQLTAVPSIYFLRRLRMLTISNSKLTDIPYIYPKSLETIDLRGNELSEKNVNIWWFPRGKLIVLLDNHFSRSMLGNEYAGQIVCWGSQRIVNSQQNKNGDMDADFDANMDIDVTIGLYTGSGFGAGEQKI